jgi:ribonuclease P protein component
MTETIGLTIKPISASQGFPRQARLLSGRDFQAVFQGKKCRISDQKLTMLARPNGLKHARLGMAISKRFAKSAVARNRIKRLVRESFRRHQQLLAGLDIVVLSREAAPMTTNSALFSSIKTHWQRIADRCVTS